MTNPVLPDIAALAERHREGSVEGLGPGRCIACWLTFPCEVVRLLDALEREHKLAMELAVVVDYAERHGLFDRGRTENDGGARELLARSEVVALIDHVRFV